MFCSNCGKKVNDSAKFCPECGFALVNANQLSTPPTSITQDTQEIQSLKSSDPPKVGFVKKTFTAGMDKLLNNETAWVNPEELAEMVYAEFILPAYEASDSKLFDKTEKLIRGPLLSSGVLSHDGSSILNVGQNAGLFGGERDVNVRHTENNTVYRIKPKDYKRFRDMCFGYIAQLRSR